MPRPFVPMFCLSIATLAAAAYISHAGPLNPPAGAVASTYKTLSEVEPRIAINATTTPGTATATFRITAPGSYYLTSNLAGEAAKNGIEIASPGVTIDLNGFELQGVPGSLDGIATTAVDLYAIAILNGAVRSWGGDGIDLGTNLSGGARISGVRAASNIGAGIRAGRGSEVSHCTATSNSGEGIATGSGCTISSCTCVGNTGSGISTGVECIIIECAVRLGGGDGIVASGGCQILNNASGSNGQATTTGANIRLTGADNRVEGNNCTSCDQGIVATTSGNLIIRNSCSGNATNWVLAANNIYGPIIDRQGAVTAAVSGSSAVSVLGTTEPNANFTY